jgi:hypothetical protein
LLPIRNVPAKLFRIDVKDGKAGTVTEPKPPRPLDHTDAMRAHGSVFLLIEGNGKLDKVTVKGDEAEIDTIKDGFAEPVSVTQVGDVGWVAEGKLSYIIGENKGKDPGPFTLADRARRDLPRKRERCSESGAGPIQPDLMCALSVAHKRLQQLDEAACVIGHRPKEGSIGFLDNNHRLLRKPASRACHGDQFRTGIVGMLPSRQIFQGFERTHDLRCRHRVDAGEFADPRLGQRLLLAEPRGASQDHKLRVRQAERLQRRTLSALPRVGDPPQQETGALGRTGEARR